MNTFPSGDEFSQLLHIEIFISGAKLIILVKINSVFSGIYILQSALFSTTDSFQKQRNERKYITIAKQKVNGLITIK